MEPIAAFEEETAAVIEESISEPVAAEQVPDAIETESVEATLGEPAAEVEGLEEVQGEVIGEAEMEGEVVAEDNYIETPANEEEAVAVEEEVAVEQPVPEPTEEVPTESEPVVEDIEETPVIVEAVDSSPATAAEQLINQNIIAVEEVPPVEELPIAESSLPEETYVEPVEEALVETAEISPVIDDIVSATFGIDEMGIEDSARLEEFEETIYPETSILDNEAQIID